MENYLGLALVFRITSKVAMSQFMDIYGDIFKKGITNIAITCEMVGKDEQHYHGYCTGMKEQTLRSRLKKHFNGNKQYKVSLVKDKELQLRYIFKGTQEHRAYVIVNTFSIDPDEARAKYWQDRADYEATKKDAPVQKQKFMDALQQRCKEKGYYQTVDVAREVFKLTDEMGKLIPTDTVLQMYVETVIYRQVGSLDNKIDRLLYKMGKPRY